MVGRCYSFHTNTSLPSCRHSNAFVNNLNNLILPVCPELGGKPLIELVRAVGTTKKCNKAQLEVRQRRWLESK